MTVPAGSFGKLAGKSRKHLFLLILESLITVSLTTSSANAIVLFSNLVSFNYTNGYNPASAVIQGIDGNFYGTTIYGGSGTAGTIYKVSTNNFALTSLFSFNKTNGYQPSGLIQATNGSFYGTTASGGAYNSLDTDGHNNGFGVIFQYVTNGTLNVLSSFIGTNGSNPNGLVQASNGTFFGTTRFGPSASNSSTGYGGIFSFNTNSGVISNLLFFNNAVGGSPTAPLVGGTNGIYYGSSSVGGNSPGFGTVFDITTNGLFTNLDTFSGNDASTPGGLIVGKDGNFYGTTAGAIGYLGEIFRLKPDGTLTALATFTTNSGYSATSIIQGQDGNLYGTTIYGGAQGYGTVFQLTTNNLLSALYSFSSTDVASATSLMQAKDGNFYGTSAYGGTNGYGNIFRLAIVPTPSFQSIVKTNGTVSLTFAAAAGHNYELQYSTNLVSTNWINLKAVATTNSVGATTDTPGTDAKRFYRILFLN